MKIGIICYPTFGGSGVVATELGKEMAKEGHEIHFISYDQPVRLDVFASNIYYHEVSVSKYPLFKYPPYELALTGKIVDIAINQKLDFLHVHYAIPHAAAAINAREILQSQGIYLPVVTTLHGTDITLVGKDASYKPVVAHSINQSDVVTAVSESLKQETLEFFKIQKDIQVIPNFVEFTRIPKEPNMELRRKFASDNEKLMIHTSNFRPVKRVDDIIRVFHSLLPKAPSKLLLVGDGPERGKLEDVCRQLNICNRVHFLGKQEAIYELLSIADIFMMASETESFGLAALEAMACSLPVISTNTGGQPEVNINGVTGFTNAVGDIEAMATHTLKLLTQKELREKMSVAAKEQAEKFTKSKILPQYHQAYQMAFEAKNSWS